MPTINKEVEVEIDLDDDEIIDALSNESEKDIIAFIKALDSAVGDWDFTKKIIQTFYKEWREDNPEEDLELSDRTLGPLQEKAEEEEEKFYAASDEPKDEPQHLHVFQSDGLCGCGESINRD